MSSVCLFELVQLGVDALLSTPLPPASLDPCTDIAVGDSHTVRDMKRVYNRLSLLSNDSSNIFKILIHYFNFFQVLVTKSGRVFTCGSDDQLQLAHGEPWRTGFPSRAIPTLVHYLDGTKLSE